MTLSRSGGLLLGGAGAHHSMVQTRGFWLNRETTHPLALSHACTHTGPRGLDTNEGSCHMNITCYLCVTFILESVMSSVFFPSMVHHTSVRESFRNVKKTSQGRIRSSPAMKGPSSPRRKGTAVQEQHLVLSKILSAWALPPFRKELSQHPLSDKNSNNSLASLDMLICDRQINRKKYPAFSNVLQIPGLHHPKGHAPCQPLPWKARQC